MDQFLQTEVFRILQRHLEGNHGKNPSRSMPYILSVCIPLCPPTVSPYRSSAKRVYNTQCLSVLVVFSHVWVVTRATSLHNCMNKVFLLSSENLCYGSHSTYPKPPVVELLLYPNNIAIQYLLASEQSHKNHQALEPTCCIAHTKPSGLCPSMKVPVE